uniref:Uncharacterized protein LOC111114368 n=1 Tax=Crassostrea virginica TaxID=6565 RepID=A0A8B8BZU3_CRAVI|nr:uncharacterized protein LOC111114368 [Crassostrea virginica]
MEGAAEQYNYLIDENCTIGVDGSQSHGPNTVISMLHHAFQEYGLGEMACHIHCDNCAGQNKNRYVMAYFCWRILVGLHREVTIHFQIPGHTKCLVDAGFAYIKKLYRRTDNDSLSDLVTTVEKSSKTNRVVVVDEAFLWRDWKTFLAEDFLPLPGIRKYHYFRFSAMNPGVVFVKETSADEELPISMSRNSTTDLSCRRLPQVLVKVNLAHDTSQGLQGTANMSEPPQNSEWSAQKVVDGNTDQETLTTCAIMDYSKAYKSVWWKVRLEKRFNVAYLEVYFRGSTSTRASGYYFYSYDSTEVFNPNSPDPNNLIYHHDPNSGCPTSIKNITVNRLAQEIVFINKRLTNYSSSCAGDDLTKTTVEICEVKVMGCNEDRYSSNRCDNRCNTKCKNRHCDAFSGSCIYGCADSKALTLDCIVFE